MSYVNKLWKSDKRPFWLYKIVLRVSRNTRPGTDRSGSKLRPYVGIPTWTRGLDGARQLDERTVSDKREENYGKQGFRGNKIRSSNHNGWTPSEEKEDGVNSRGVNTTVPWVRCTIVSTFVCHSMNGQNTVGRVKRPLHSCSGQKTEKI